MKFFKLDNTYTYINDTQLTIKDYSHIKPVINFSLADYICKAKDLINTHLQSWDTMKKYTNLYEYVHTPYEYKNYVSKVKPLSRAYYKLIEILDDFNILDKYSYKNIHSFHLAEGPGGFIEAISYKRNNSNDVYYGMTLVNDDINTPGWKKSQDFLMKHENVEIITGADRTGNLMNPDNYQYIYDNHKHSMEVVTGDGGFDFSTNYNKQEESIINLIFAQVIYALALQKKGGSFVLKVFDMYTLPTIQIIYLLHFFYDEVYICKPHTSRIANSEKYIVCKGLKGNLNEVYFKRFKNILQLINNNNATCNEEINATKTPLLTFFLNIDIQYDFLKQLTLINSIFGQQQLENIHKTISLTYSKVSREKIQNDKLKHVEKCIKWCKIHDIPHNEIVKKNIFSFSS